MELIDKAALVAEIEKLEKLYCYGESNGMLIAKSVFDSIKNIINTLEVKEVDLEKEVESYWKETDLSWCRDAYSITHIRSMLSSIAKHFFELGLKAQKGEEV